MKHSHLRILLPLILTGTAMPLFADPLEGPYYHGHMDGWGMGLFGLGFMILFWGGLAVVVVLAIRWIGEQNGGGTTGRRSGALDILKERLARGEIDIEDYEARRKHLEG